LEFVNRREMSMNDAQDTKREFRLSDLDTQLKALLPNMETVYGAYYCCECVGNPDCPSQA
jgi:hypothetical protein